jgi:peptide deformylase
MAVLEILEFPDPRLRVHARRVDRFDEALSRLASDMIETMYEASGVGLAATQVDSDLRMVVIDTSESRDQARVFVNPEVLSSSPEEARNEEGCLSVPGYFDFVVRPARVRVRAQDLQGQAFELDCEGMLAVCVQHEIDHLDGRVFVDHLSLLKQARVRTKFRKRRDRD